MKKVQLLQSQILLEHQQSFVGKTLNCICESEVDEGKVTLVNAKNIDGELVEVEERTYLV